MKLVFLGVRGSTPTPGAAYLRYGGHTSCLAVLADGERVPSLVLDAGTGLRDLDGLLGGQPFRGAVALTHLHWDHVQGLPFCPPMDRPDARVELHLPGDWDPDAGSGEATALLARAMSPPHFPIGPDGLQGGWRFLPARPGPLASAGPAQVTAVPVPHKGGVTYGYRLDLDGASVGYVPDHAALPDLAAPPDLAALPDQAGPNGDPAAALLTGVDVLVHDGQYLPRERATAAAYGHSVVDDAVLLADRYAVGELVLTHHAPGRTDDELDALAASLTSTPQGRPVRFARQGLTLEVPARRREPVIASAERSPG